MGSEAMLHEVVTSVSFLKINKNPTYRLQSDNVVQKVGAAFEGGGTPVTGILVDGVEVLNIFCQGGWPLLVELIAGYCSSVYT